MMPVTITRRKKHEAEMAIKDLIARGYVVTYPLTERRSSMEQRGTYNHTKGRYTSKHVTESSCWIAKLKKEEK